MLGSVVLADSLSEARRLDAADPLAGFRNRFSITDPQLIYLDGNSLGRLPKQTVELMSDAVTRQWGERLIRSWNDGWWTLTRRLGAKVAQLIGAEPDEVIVADSTSVNLFKLLVALLENLRPAAAVVVDGSTFPSDGYIVQSAARLAAPEAEIRWVELDHGDDRPVPAAFQQAFQRRPKLAVMCHVDFRSGYRFDLGAVNQCAKDAATTVVWDLSHSLGVVPIDVGRDGVRAAVGCTYKFLNGGPGAPAIIYLARELQDQLKNPIGGWFGHIEPFAMVRDYLPAAGIERFLTGTPPVLSTLAIEPGVDLALEAGAELIAQKSERMFDFLATLLDQLAAPFGCEVVTPRFRHGSHLALRHPGAQQICRALLDAGVVPDFRRPDIVRFGLAPLYNTFGELAEAAHRLHGILKNEIWRRFAETAEVVT